MQKKKTEPERPVVTGDERVGRGPGYLHGYRPAVEIGGKMLSRPSMHKPSVRPRRVTKRERGNTA